MTANQIKYAEHLEQKRHNMASEAEQARHNVRSEDVGFYSAGAAYAGVGENRRHNQEQERINWYIAPGTRSTGEAALISARTGEKKFVTDFRNQIMNQVQSDKKITSELAASFLRGGVAMFPK